MRLATLRYHRARVCRLAAYLGDHLEEPFDTTTAAKLAGLSARQLERVFARAIGESPRAHLRRMRLERAAFRLRNSRMSVLAIAIEADFESQAAFTRVFRRRFGHTPAAFRRLDTATAQPCIRTQLWQLAIAGGLRRHVEG